MTAKADEALEATAGDADPPSQSDLAAWVAHCPHDVLTEVEERLGVMWWLKPKQVRVIGWAFGGLVVWRDDVEFHAPASELVAEALRRNILNPLISACECLPDPGGRQCQPSARPHPAVKAGDGQPVAQAGWPSVQPCRAPARPAGNAGVRVCGLRRPGPAPGSVPAGR